MYKKFSKKAEFENERKDQEKELIHGIKYDEIKEIRNEKESEAQKRALAELKELSGVN